MDTNTILLVIAGLLPFILFVGVYIIKELRDSFNEHLRSNQILGETSESLNQILQTLNENTELLKQIDGTLKGSIEELNKDTAKQAKEIKDTIEKGVESLNQTLKEELKLE